MPYSKVTWQIIKTVTRTTKDTGFEILRSHVDEANSNLGPHAAETAALFEHVTAPEALNAAIATVKYDVEKSRAEEPTEIDTFANLLFRSGRAQEA